MKIATIRQKSIATKQIREIYFKKKSKNVFARQFELVA